MKIKDWVIIGLTIVVIALILFPQGKPSLDPDKKAYQDTLTFLRRYSSEIRASGAKIISKAQERAKKDSINLRAQDKEIQALKAKSIEYRIKVVTKIEADPDLKAFVSVQDSTIQTQDSLISDLKASVSFHIQTQRDLIQNFEAERSISKRIEHEQDKRISDLEKQNRKEKRKRKLATILIPIVGVGALFLGGL